MRYDKKYFEALVKRVEREIIQVDLFEKEKQETKGFNMPKYYTGFKVVESDGETAFGKRKSNVPAGAEWAAIQRKSKYLPDCPKCKYGTPQIIISSYPPKGKLKDCTHVCIDCGVGLVRIAKGKFEIKS